MKINAPIDIKQPDTPRPAGTPTAAAAASGGAGTAASAGAAGTAATSLKTAPGPIRVSIPNVQPFDSAKVERIKEAIRNGEFQIDSTAVAHKLLTSVNELFARQH